MPEPTLQPHILAQIRRRLAKLSRFNMRQVDEGCAVDFLISLR
jgi:hypothetical protein